MPAFPVARLRGYGRANNNQPPDDGTVSRAALYAPDLQGTEPSGSDKDFQLAGLPVALDAMISYCYNLTSPAPG